MLQVAEVLCEERVQMKLIDAKLALESKYSHTNKLITVLGTFLRSRSRSLDVTELKKAELVRQAVKSVNIQDMEEFSYEPLRSGDIFSILEERQQVERPSGFVDYNSGMEEDSRGREIVNHAENQGFVQESGCSVFTVGGCKNAPRCEMERDETTGRDSPNTETSEVCSISAEQSKWKTSSAKLRISCASSSGSYNAIPDEGNGRLSSGTVSCLGTIFSN
ncbi:hypothetical protein CRYUN_Cryun34aG0012800 [Craigia yunnanensis]